MKNIYRNTRAALLAGLLGAACTMSAATSQAATWSDTEVQVLWGDKFTEPFNPNDVTKTIVTLQHASGWDYGRNFFFVDFLNADDAGGNTGEVYGEWYSTFSLGKIFKKDLKFSIIKDVGITGGLNYGATSGSGPTANPEVYTYGITLDFDIPKFAFFNVDFQVYSDHGKFGAGSNGCNEDTYQITPSWKLPFEIGPTKWTFEGFADFIGSHGACASQILTQPQIRMDVGDLFGRANSFFVGIEYQYWDNKYGFGIKDDFPQLLTVWKF